MPVCRSSQLLSGGWWVDRDFVKSFQPFPNYIRSRHVAFLETLSVAAQVLRELEAQIFGIDDGVREYLAEGIASCQQIHARVPELPQLGCLRLRNFRTQQIGELRTERFDGIAHIRFALLVHRWRIATLGGGKIERLSDDGFQLCLCRAQRVFNCRLLQGGVV